MKHNSEISEIFLLAQQGMSILSFHFMLLQLGWLWQQPKNDMNHREKKSFHPLFSSKDLSQQASKRPYNNYIKALLQHSEVESPQTITLEKPEVHVSWTWQFWDDVNPEKVGTTEGLTRRASNFGPWVCFWWLRGSNFTHTLGGFRVYKFDKC